MKITIERELVMSAMTDIMVAQSNLASSRESAGPYLGLYDQYGATIATLGAALLAAPQPAPSKPLSHPTANPLESGGIKPSKPRGPVLLWDGARWVRAEWVERFAEEDQSDGGCFEYDENEVPYVPAGWYELQDHDGDAMKWHVEVPDDAPWMPLPPSPSSSPQPTANSLKSGGTKPGMEPYGWSVTGVFAVFLGDTAQQDAEAVARRCGGTVQAFALYREMS